MPVQRYNTGSVPFPDQTSGQQDVVIAVMGTTGSGKSSFIRLLTGDSSVRTSGGLDSETSEIQVVRFYDNASGRNVVLVDTPGFDDSRDDMTDTDVLKKIANFLVQEYDKERKLNGLIYVQRVSDIRFGGQSGRNLRMFRNLCGEKTYKNVVVLTTFWDKAREEGEEREEQLKSKFFKDLVGGGARFMRHNCTLESAHAVLQHIFTLVPATVQIQEEIRVEGKRVEDTAAGSVRREELDQIITKHQQEVAELKAEMDATSKRNLELMQELAVERANLQEKIARWEEERLELAQGLGHEREARERFQAEAAADRERYDRWRQEQEADWSSRFESQAKEQQKVMAELQDQLRQEKDDHARWQWQELIEANKRTWEAQQQAMAAERARADAEANRGDCIIC